MILLINVPSVTLSVYCPGYRTWMTMIMMKYGMTMEQMVFRILVTLVKVMEYLMKPMVMSGKAGILVLETWFLSIVMETI